ncbi:O-antigen ligase family protein [Blastopirellula marina]|uniref:Hemocyanin type 1-like protein n=1 Tax=Blastopirellula marina DSM 3645 TaxID=314230 RepID=A3ZZS9_9BACT|nr:O-antigen ligase family protein [Blastopirellula marina]EAQ78028.1 hemocyanin type 1-like protein [Blastopirellula marina DSM 3645]
MKRRNKSSSFPPSQSSRAASAPAPPASPGSEWFSLLLCGYVACLTVLTPLIGSEGPVGRGVELPWVLMWLWALALWAIGGLLSGKLSIVWSKWESLLLALLAWLAIGVTMVAGSGEVRPAINQFWTYAGLVIAYFLYRQLFRSAARKRALIAIVIATVTVCATYAIYQYRVEIPQMQADYLADKEQGRRDAGIAGDDDDPQVRNFESRLMSTEPASTFTLTNSLAGFLAVGLIITAGVAIQQVRARSYLQAAVLAVILCLLCGTLILTKSRTAVLAVVAGMGLWGILASSLRRHLPWKYLVGGVLLLAIAVGGGFASGLLDREVFTEAPKSVLYRLQYWQGALDVTAERPLFGCGLGNFQSFYPRYMPASASETIADPHNFLLEIAASAGVPAVLLLLGFIAVWLLRFPTGSQAEPTLTAAEGSPEQAPDASIVPIFVGALVAFLLAPPIRAVMQGESPIWMMWIGLPLALAVAGATYGWSRRGTLDLLTLRIAAIVLMINLLAAGGISFPAVALWLWLFWGLTLGSDKDQTLQLEAFSSRAGVALAAVVLLYGMVTVALFPVMSSFTSLYGVVNETFSEQVRLAKKAAAADPYSVDGPQILANVYFQAWKSSPVPPNVNGAQQAVAETLRRSPRNVSLQSWIANNYWELYQKYEDPAILKLAIERQESVCRDFPTRGYHHVELAQMYAAAGRNQEAAQQATEALRLDAMHDHSELKFENRRFDDGRSVLTVMQELANSASTEKNQTPKS